MLKEGDAEADYPPESGLLCGGDWTKRGPSEPGEYYMTDEGGGPTLYVCEYIDGELMCGPKIGRRGRSQRFSLDSLRMESTKWERAI